MSSPARALWAFGSVGCLVIGLHLVLPGPVTWWNWGFSLLGLLPAAVGWVLLGLLVGAMFLAGRMAGWGAGGGTGQHRLSPPVFHRAAPLVLCIAAGVVFWVFRTRTHFLGDAALRIVNLAEHKHGISYSLLDSFLLYRVYEPLQARWGLDAGVFLALVSCASGAAFVLLLLGLARDTGCTAFGRAFVFLLAATAGYMMVFFGYAETYGPLCLFVLIYLVAGHRALHGRGHPFFAVVAFLLAVAVHRASVVLLGSALYLLYRYVGVRGMEPGKHGGIRRAVLAVVLLGVVAVGVVYLFGGLGLGARGMSVLVPLTEAGTDAERRPYALFSPIHLANVVNQHLLLSPVGALLSLSVLLACGWRSSFREPWVRFLALGAVPWFLLSAVWASDLGSPRDWDIFAPAALLYTLLGATLALPFLAAGRRRLSLAVAVLLVGGSLFHTIPWVWVNAGEQTGLARFERLVETQKGWGSFAHAYAYDVLGGHELESDRLLQAAEHFRRAAEIYPSARYDLQAGVAFLYAGETRRAVLALAKAVKRDPKLADAYVYLGMAYLKEGMSQEALRLFETALELRPDLEDIREVVETLRAGGEVDLDFGR